MKEFPPKESRLVDERNHSVKRYEGNAMTLLETLMRSRETGRFTVELKLGGVILIEFDTRERGFSPN